MIYLSASRMRDYKNCATLYKLPVVDRIYPDVEADPLRVGTNWHGIQEIIGINLDSESKYDQLIKYIDDLYGERPIHISEEDWLVERNTFIYTAWAYFNYYEEIDKDVEVVASELEFELPLIHPETGRSVPNVRIRGRLDKLINYPDRGLFLREYKSTSSSVEDGSSFWPALRMALQPSIYYDAAKRMGYDIQGIEYDVWHKPTIKPKFLTQKNTKEFLETGKYFGQEFIINSGIRICENMLEAESYKYIILDDEIAIVEPGKKEGTFTIKETPRMFGVRLYNDIMERPTFYFNRREISRTEDDMNRFRWELYNTYKTIKNMMKSGCWMKNEDQCERMGKCQYIPICYNNVNVDESTPDGFHQKEKVKE